MLKNGKDYSDGLNIPHPIMGSNILPSPRGSGGMRESQNALLRAIRNPSKIFAVALIVLCLCMYCKYYFRQGNC